jgi:putative transposase
VIHDQAAMGLPSVGAQHAPPLRAKRGISFRPNVQPGSLGAIVRSYKSAVTRAIVREFGGVPRIWQRNYYEHIIRDDDDWNRIHLYIEANVANWAEDDENPSR